ncbi:hypothetical protein RYH80_10210 [Halobaculum sp. MBLA0147]|uniref:hypothetical protein n=1 Tax=Halobaculum sp. MBLA0147 TaxID=3079934 RepID=UPI003524DF78
MSTETLTTDDYRTLQQRRREVAGNEERATVREVTLTDATARLRLGFAWADADEHVSFDLHSERDVLALESLAAAAGYDFDHLPYLEGETVAVTYLDGEWVPTATLPTATESDVFGDDDDGLSGLDLAERLAHGVSDRVERLDAQQVVLGVIVFKKLLIVSTLVYLLLT